MKAQREQRLPLLQAEDPFLPGCLPAGTLHCPAFTLSLRPLQGPEPLAFRGPYTLALLGSSSLPQLTEPGCRAPGLCDGASSLEQIGSYVSAIGSVSLESLSLVQNVHSFALRQSEGNRVRSTRARTPQNSQGEAEGCPEWPWAAGSEGQECFLEAGLELAMKDEGTVPQRVRGSAPCNQGTDQSPAEGPRWEGPGHAAFHRQVPPMTRTSPAGTSPCRLWSCGFGESPGFSEICCSHLQPELPLLTVILSQIGI